MSSLNFPQFIFSSLQSVLWSQQDYLGEDETHPALHGKSSTFMSLKITR